MSRIVCCPGLCGLWVAGLWPSVCETHVPPLQGSNKGPRRSRTDSPGADSDPSFPSTHTQPDMSAALGRVQAWPSPPVCPHHRFRVIPAGFRGTPWPKWAP